MSMNEPNYERAPRGPAAQPYSGGGYKTLCGDQLASFASMLERKYGHHSVKVHTPDASPRLELARQGPFDVGMAIGNEIAWYRSNHQLSDEWHDSLFLVFQHRGRTSVEHCGRKSVLHASDLMLVRPVGDCGFEMPVESALISLNLPQTWLDGVHAELLRLAGRPIDGSRGMGRILSGMLSSLPQASCTFDDDDRLALSEAVVAILARCKDASAGVSAPRTRLTLQSLKGWVIENIHEPCISPKMLASVANLSLRQLYRLFALEGSTPQAWLSQVRLGEAYVRLQQETGQSVTNIAFSVGFNDAAHFSRAFRKRYGMAPRMLRSTC